MLLLRMGCNGALRRTMKSLTLFLALNLFGQFSSALEPADQRIQAELDRLFLSPELTLEPPDEPLITVMPYEKIEITKKDRKRIVSRNRQYSVLSESSPEELISISGFELLN